MNFETRPYIVGSISRPRLIALRITVHVLWKRVIASHVRWACYLAFYDSTRRYITLSYVNTCASASVSRVTTRHRRACKISRTSTWRNYLFEKRNPARPICWRRNIATMRKISRRNSYLWIRSIILFSSFLVREIFHATTCYVISGVDWKREFLRKYFWNTPLLLYLLHDHNFCRNNLKKN